MSHSISVFGDQNQLFDPKTTIETSSSSDFHSEDGRIKGTRSCKKLLTSLFDR